MRLEFRRLKAESGVAMVEFAIALPLLLLLLLAVAEFGRMFHQYNGLVQASRDACRYVSGKAWDRTLGKIVLDGDLVSRTKQVALYDLSLPGKYDPEPEVYVEPVGSEHVVVRIVYTFEPVVGSGIPGFIGGAISLQIPLVASTVMRAL